MTRSFMLIVFLFLIRSGVKGQPTGFYPSLREEFNHL